MIEDLRPARPAAPAASPLLSVSALGARYPGNGSAGVEALRQVSFSLSPADMLVVVGPNGSGKSTLLHALAGDAPAQVSGTATLAGQDLLALPMHHRMRHVALVHQNPARGTAAHLTLREHCALTISSGAGRRPVDWSAVAGRLRATGTALDPDQPAGELSGGQRQLFTTVLAVLSGPRLLLLDEPTSALDTRHSTLVREVIADFRKRDRSASVLVTHDMTEALRFATHLLVLTARGEVHALLDADRKSALTADALRDLLTAASATAWTSARTT